MVVGSSRDGENKYAPCPFEGCMKELKAPFKNERNGKLQPGPSVCERAKPSLADGE